MSRAAAKDDLSEYLHYGGFGRVIEEYQFHPTRKWRADWFLPDQKPPVIIEYDGLMHHGKNHGHASIGGILRDSEKANAAQSLGIRYFRGNAKTVSNGEFFTFLNDVLTQTFPTPGGE